MSLEWGDFMNCPNCKSEMEKGMLFNNATGWTNKLSDTLLKIGSAITMTKALYAYRCPKCGKVELTTAVK